MSSAHLAFGLPVPRFRRTPKCGEGSHFSTNGPQASEVDVAILRAHLHFLLLCNVIQSSKLSRPILCSTSRVLRRIHSCHGSRDSSVVTSMLAWACCSVPSLVSVSDSRVTLRLGIWSTIRDGAQSVSKSSLVLALSSVQDRVQPLVHEFRKDLIQNRDDTYGAVVLWFCRIPWLVDNWYHWVFPRYWRLHGPRQDCVIQFQKFLQEILSACL